MDEWQQKSSGRPWLKPLTPLLAVVLVVLIAQLGPGYASAASILTQHLPLRIRVVTYHVQGNEGLRVTARTSSHAICGLTVRGGRSTASLPNVRASAGGRAGWRWLVPVRAPRGVWKIRVGCATFTTQHLTGAAHGHSVVHPLQPSPRGGLVGLSSIAITAGTPAKKPKSGLGGTAGDPYPAGECTWWAWHERPDLPWFRGDSGNALNWGTSAKAHGIPTGHTPIVHSIVVFQPGQYGASSYGHVAYVVSVNSGSFVISEMNATAGFGNTDKRTVRGAGSSLTFIYGGPAGNGPAKPSDKTPPSAPTGLSTSGITANSITLSWSASSDNVGVQGYKLFLNGNQVGKTTARTYTFSSLNCAAGLTLGVAAYDAAGNTSSTTSVGSATRACSGDASPPSEPGNLHAISKNFNSATVAWNASTDNVGVAGYFVYVNGSHMANETGTSAKLGLTCGHSYTIGVNAYDAAGNHSATRDLTVSISACPTGTIITNSGDSPCLDFHSGPGHTYTKIGCIPDGTKINIDCIEQGNAVTGPYGTETIWDHTNYAGKAGYVADAFVYTGVNGAVAPTC